MDARSTLRPPRVDYEFSDSERQRLIDGLLSVSSNPYTDHASFLAQIESLARTDYVSPEFRAFSDESKEKDKIVNPITFVRKAPIDPVVPNFDWVDPVVSKRQTKRTFVCEGFLALFSQLQNRPVIAHLSVNDGDFYHDIFPKKDMATTQSQKTERTLYFHKDFTNHFARPDCVYTLTIRNSEENEVISTYVSNAEVIEALPASTRDTLRQPIFATPFDDVSMRQNSIALGDAPNHAIIEGDVEFRVFENRTSATTPDGAAALEALLRALHEHKIGIHQVPGDFVAIENDYCLHGREVGRVNSPTELRRRWLMKTHNVKSLAKFAGMLLPDRPAVING